MCIIRIKIKLDLSQQFVASTRFAFSRVIIISTLLRNYCEKADGTRIGRSILKPIILIPLDKRRLHANIAPIESTPRSESREFTFRSRRTVVVDLSPRINRKRARARAAFAAAKNSAELFSRNPQRGLAPYPIDRLSHAHCEQPAGPVPARIMNPDGSCVHATTTTTYYHSDVWPRPRPTSPWNRVKRAA